MAIFFKLIGKDLLEAFSLWRSSRGIPYLVNWVNSDNTLLLDFQTEIGIQLFLKSAGKETKLFWKNFYLRRNLL